MSRHIALALLLVACEAQRSAPAPWSPARSANQGPKTDPRRPEAPDAGAAPKEELLFAAVVAPTPRALRATLGSCASAGCTLVVTFDQPVGEPDDLPSPESLGARVASSGPAELSWRSSTELEIIPKPGSFAHGEQVRVEVAAAGLSEELTVPYFTAAGKTAAWPVIRGKPRVIDALDDHTRLVGKRPILLLYDQPVELTRKFRATFHAVSASGASLPLSVFRPSDLGDLVDEPVALEHVVAVRVGALPSAGEPIELVYPSNTDESPTERSRFTVAESRPTVLSEDAAGPFTASPWLVPIDARIRLDFAAPVRQRTLESTLSIEPTPKSRNVLVYGSSAYVSMTLEPGMNYRFKLDRKLTDILGNSSGNASVTLRTRDLPPALELPNGPVVALERGRARLAVRALNVNVVQPEAVRLDDETFARALASGQADCQTIAGERSPLGTFRTHVLTNQRGDFEIPLDLGTNRKSQLCVLLRGQPIGSEASAPLLASALVQSSGLGMTTKLSPRGGIVFVTRLADAAPVKGANVEILDAEGKRLSIEARTDRDGIAEINPGPSSPLPSELFVVARVRDDSVIARVSDDTTSRAWQFGIPAEQPNLEAAVFTDRGVYRPGESVKVKIVARPDDSVPRAGKVRVQVRDSRDQALLDKDQATDRFGGADLDVPLAAQAPVGEYSILVTHESTSTRRTFRVEEYRVPTFKVAVELPDAPAGSLVTAKLSAQYLFGGALSGRAFRWQLVKEPAAFSPKGFDGYVFGVRGAQALASSGEGTLELDGAKKLSIPLEASGAPIRYVLDASVTDLDRQAWAGRASRVVHGADVYVGLRPPARAVLSAIEPIELAVATVKSSGEPTPAKVSIRLHRIDHHSAVRGLGTGATELASRPVGVEVRALEVETDESGRASSSLDSPGPGAYELTVSVRDTNGRESSARNRVTVGGEGSIAWPRFDHERIDLVTDKPRYKVGDVAKLVVKTPFEEATALLTIERSGVLLHRLVTIRRDTPIIEVPIEERFAPNVFASIVVLRGRAHGERDAFGFETGAPAFRMGYAQLEVGRESRRLPLSVTLDRTTAAPGEDLTIDVSTTGKKLSPGEVTIAVVDEAVLAMTHFVTPDPLPELLPAKGLGIRTAETRLDLPYSRRERQERIFPSGDGGDGFALSTMPDEVRKLMKSTAYWNPRVALDRNGHARVQFTLPDNLTTYRVMIVGYDLEGRAGSSEAKITIRKPLMAQPVLPRFARPADTFRAEVRVFDGTGVGGIVDGRFELSGLELDKREAGRPDATAKGRGTRLEQRLELPANGSVAFEVPVVVTGRGEARIRFAAALGASKDAVEISLPILQTGAERKLVISRAISRRGEIEVPLPAGRVPGTTHLEVLASSTNLSELKDSVEYLMQYPNGCIEQTTSTAYPLVVLEDLLPDMGVTVNRENLRKFATAGVERILSFQTQSGGLSYWPGGAEPHAFATSFGLTALIEAKKRGYDVPSEKLARMADYLESALARGSVTEQIPHGAIADGDTRALFVMTLGRLGRPQPAWISTLWRERAKLSPFGLGFLAVALEESSGDKSLVPEVLAAIRQASVEKESESYFELARKGGFSFDSPLRTHASSLLAFASTSGGEAGAKLMNGLLKRKTGYGIWGNTQENVFGIMAVAKMATQTPSGAVSPLTIGLDGETVQAAGAEAGSKRTVRYSVGPDRLALPAEARTHRIEIAASDAKPVKVTVRATYEASLDDPKNRAASANGFTLKRTVTTLDGKAVTEDLALGSLVRVALDVTTDAARHYVAISDPLPAGLEALNASLDTTERVTLGEATAEVTAALAKLSFSEVRDARVAFFADDLPAGAYRWVYVARVTTAGRYLRPAARVEEMYQESIAATTEVDFVEVR